MDDLRKALSSLDSIEAPDLWTEIERRAAVLEGSQKLGATRLQPLFSRTKFVVAGAIVALLYGGLLLMGVLGQQSDVRQPGASPSATPAPLPSVEVEPGVSRILVEGDARAIATGPDGSLWRIRLDETDTATYVEPLQGEEPPVVPIEAWMIEVGPDGTVWVAGDAVGAWDGQEWAIWNLPAGQEAWTVLPGPDGTALVPWFAGNGNPVEGSTDTRIGLDRLSRDGLREPGEALTVVVPEGTDLDFAFAQAPDGDVWAVTARGARSESGDEGRIWRWDGETWHVETVPGVGGDVRPRDVAAGSDGSVWVYFADDNMPWRAAKRRLARLQDGGWTVWTEEDGVPRVGYEPNPRMRVGHDGALWAPADSCAPSPGLVRFDGVTSVYLADWCIQDTTVAQDGSIWVIGMNVDGAESGLFRVTPADPDQTGHGAEPSLDGSPDMGALEEHGEG